MGVSLKNSIFRGRVGRFTKRQLPKKRGGGVGELGQKERVETRLENVWQLNKRRGKMLDISLLLRHRLTYLITYLLIYLLACLEAAWSCHILKKVKTISAQKRTLMKSYEYLQTPDK